MGFINPVVVDHRRKIVTGHGRFEAAKLLGLIRIPVICVEHLSDAQLRAYSLADNKLAERAGWDREALAVELEELQVLLPEIGLDLSVTGFEPGEADALLLDFEEDRPNPSDLVEPPTGPAVSRSGDLFVLGKHRLIVADARQQKTFDRLMHGEMAEMAFLDPPYNVRIVGHVGGRGRTSIASSSAPRARCPQQSSRGSCNRPSAYVRATRSTAASITSAWTGGTQRSCSPPVRWSSTN